MHVLVTVCKSTPECKVSRHVCICLWFYACSHVCLWVCVRTNLCVFGIHPAGGKEGKLPFAAFSPPLSFRNTKGYVLVPVCFLITFPPLSTSLLLPAAAPLLCLSAPGVTTAQHNFLFPSCAEWRVLGWACDLSQTTQTPCSGFCCWN